MGIIIKLSDYCDVLNGKLYQHAVFFSHPISLDYFLVGQVKMESHSLLNGMKVREPLREHTMGSERNLPV